MNEQMSNADPMQQPQMQPQMQQPMMQPQMQPMQYQQPMMANHMPFPPNFQPQEGIGAAVTALISGILNVLLAILSAFATANVGFSDLAYIEIGGNFWHIVFTGLALFFGLTALKKTCGRGMAVAGIVLAMISPYIRGFFWGIALLVNM